MHTPHEDRSPAAAGCIAALLLAVVSNAADAAACLYRGTDESARVIGRSNEIVVPFPQTQSSGECEKLRVAVGTVSVYVLNADRTAISVHQTGVNGGPLVRRAEAAPGTSASTESGMFKEILLVLAGGQRSTAGSSRSAEADYVVGVLPVGKLAAPGADLRVPLGPVADANLAGFELIVDGRSVYRQRGPAPELRLPAAALTPGARATWRLTYSGQTHEGRFTVVPAEQLKALQDSLDHESEPGTDPGVARLRLASGLLAEGYAWDARAVIREVVAP